MPGMPNSANVGTAGVLLKRFADATASGRIFPPCKCWIALVEVMMAMST